MTLTVILFLRCAHVANLKATDWAINGVGRNYSHSFGYGVMDATCMVRLAKVWKTVGEKKMCSQASHDANTIIPGKQGVQGGASGRVVKSG